MQPELTYILLMSGGAAILIALAWIIFWLIDRRRFK